MTDRRRVKRTHRKNPEQHLPKVYMPAMPPLGLVNAVADALRTVLRVLRRGRRVPSGSGTKLSG